MTKTARQILAAYGDTHRNRAYDFDSGGLTESEYKGHFFSDIDQALKELEATMLGVIGDEIFIDPTALFVLQAEKLAQNELRKHQRNRMRSALYGEEKK